MSEPDPRLAQAITAHRSGHLQEAVSLYEAILTERPDDADTLHFYGMICFQLGHKTEGIGFVGRSLTLAPNNAHAWNNLGNMLWITGDAQKAIDAYMRAVQCNPDLADVWFNLGVCLRDAGELEGSVEAFRSAISSRQDFLRAYESLGMLLYKAGDLERAVQVFRDWLAIDPDNITVKHMVLALTGAEKVQRADPRYVKDLFDGYAKSFDGSLRALGYRAPEVVSSLLAVNLAGRTVDILDAGCGTGLCGPLLRPLARTLVGVDLSPNMIGLARERGYDELVVEELATFLRSRVAQFDVVAAADTFEYFGDLGEVHEATRLALRASGLYLFTVEMWPENAPEPFKLQVNGRFAHKGSYLRQSLEAAGFEVLEIRSEVLRTERLQDVAGWVAIARRPPD